MGVAFFMSPVSPSLFNNLCQVHYLMYLEKWIREGNS